MGFGSIGGNNGGDAPVATISMPAHYQCNVKWGGAKTIIAPPSDIAVQIDGGEYSVTNAPTIDIAQAANWDSAITDYTVAANRAGKDFYVYACKSDGAVPRFVLSANSTAPVGHTTFRKVGGFHCLCLSVGTISGHTLSDYVTGDILPASVWDLNFRPVSAPEGMVYIAGVNVWMGIYFLSSSGTTSNRQLVTRYNGVIADGDSSPTWSDFDFIETLGKQILRLPSNDELIVATQGSPQAVAISGAADPNTTGGHVSTSNVRIISNYGVEDGCGVMWTFCKECFYSSGYVRGAVGGPWCNGSACGSRSVGSLNVGYLSPFFGARAVSEAIINAEASA